jgi:hypothetical protein
VLSEYTGSSPLALLETRYSPIGLGICVMLEPEAVVDDVASEATDGRAVSRRACRARPLRAIRVGIIVIESMLLALSHLWTKSIQTREPTF